MPRRKRIRQSEPPSIDDILAGRVENEPFFDIDDLPVDAPAIAEYFVPTPLNQVISGEVGPDSGRDIGAAADEALIGFDPMPESLRNNPDPAGNFRLWQEQVEFEAEQRRRQREGLPPSSDLQYEIDRRKRHLRSGRPRSEFFDPEAEIENKLMRDHPHLLPVHRLRKARRKVLKEKEERQAYGLRTLPKHVRQLHQYDRELAEYERDLAKRVASGSVGINDPRPVLENDPRPVLENVSDHVIPIPKVGILDASTKGIASGATNDSMPEIIGVVETPSSVLRRAIRGEDKGKGVTERFVYALNRNVALRRFLIEEAKRQQPLAFRIGEAAGILGTFPRRTPALLVAMAQLAAESLAPKNDPATSRREIGRVVNRIRNTPARRGSRLDQELNSLFTKLVRPDGTLIDDAAAIKSIVEDFHRRSDLPTYQPGAINAEDNRRLLPVIRKLESQLQ